MRPATVARGDSGARPSADSRPGAAGAALILVHERSGGFFVVVRGGCRARRLLKPLSIVRACLAIISKHF